MMKSRISSRKATAKLSLALTYFEVVKDVTDERDVAHPLLQRAAPGLLAALELLLQSVQQVSPEHVSIALLGLGLRGVTKSEGGRETERESQIISGEVWTKSQETQWCRYNGLKASHCSNVIYQLGIDDLRGL